MMGRVVLPMEEMAARASASDLDDPLAHVRACALNVLGHLTSNLQCQRVFEICCHKVEYVDEMNAGTPTPYSSAQLLPSAHGARIAECREERPARAVCESEAGGGELT